MTPPEAPRHSIGVVSDRRFSIGGAPGRTEWLWLGLILLLYTLAAAVIIKGGGPLGHDEAVYALRGRDFHDGTSPGAYWDDYRAPGLPWLLRVMWPLGSTAPYLRLVSVGFMLLLILVTWLLARALFGPTAGLAAAGGLAATPFLVEASSQVWPDVPGAALGLAAIAMLVFSTSGDRTSWWVLAAPVLVAGATYLRFGAPMQLVVGLAAVGLWRWRVVARDPFPTGIAAVLSAAAVWVILNVPEATGSTLAPLDSIGGRRRQWLEGFADYLGDSGRIVGTVAGFLLAAGVVLLIVRLARGDVRRDTGFLVLGAGAATFAVTAGVLHGELRYLSPTMPWAWIAAGAGLAGAVRWVPRSAAPWLAAVMAVTLLVSAVREGDDVGEFNAEQFNAIVDASEAVGDLAGDRSCGVVTGFIPQVAWYSGCATDGYDLQRVTYPEGMVRASDVVYLLWAQEGKRQPDAALWEDYVDSSHGLVHREEGRRIVEVYLAGTG